MKNKRLIWTICGLFVLVVLLSSRIGSFLTKLGGAGFLAEFKDITVTVVAVLLGALIDRIYLLDDLRQLLQERLSSQTREISLTIREELVPMNRDFGVSKVHQFIEFKGIISALQPRDNIDILFTFHPDIERYLPDLLTKITQQDVTCRLLLGCPDSQAVKCRFDYITEAADGYFWSIDMIGHLRTFVEITLPTILSKNRQMAQGRLFEVKCFQDIPDIPLIIVTRSDGGEREIVSVLQGYYLRPPAMELPFIQWDVTNVRSRGSRTMAGLFLSYFDMRWTKGVSIQPIKNVRDNNEDAETMA